MLAIISFLLERYEEALELIEQVIMNNSDIGDYWFFHSQALFYLDRPWKNSLQKALEIEPDNDEYLFCKGKFLLIEDSTAAGLQSINEAIKIEPNEGEYWYWRGQGLLDYGNEKVALESLEKSVSIEPDNDEYRKSRDEVKRKILFG